MRVESTHTALPVVKIALLAGLLTTAAAVGPADASAATGNLSITAGANLVAVREAVIATAASKALRHIAQARGDLKNADTAGAERELDKASALFDLVDASLPTAIAKELIWTAVDHLGYEDAAKVMPDLSVIDSSLDDLAASMPATSAQKHLDNAKTLVSKNDKAGATAELNNAAASLVYTEVDLPLGMTRRQVAAARAALKRGDVAAAGKALKIAEDNVVFLSVAAHDPLTEAHRSLWQAARDYGAGAYDAAKVELDRAIRYLDYLANGADAKTDAAANAIAQQARAVRNSVGKKSESAAVQLTALWKRTKALSDRSVAYFTTSWQRIGQKSDYKADLIEARFHLSYAEIDRRAKTGGDQVKKELEQAESYLNKAQNSVQKAYSKSIAAVNARVKELAANDAPDQHDSQYAALKTELDKLIETL